MRFFYEAKIDRIVDGDTIDLIVDLGFDVSYKTRVRLAGVDTYEVRTKNLEEKELGIAAKAFVEDWLNAHDKVYVRTLKDSSGKFGRILGYIYADEEMVHCLNDALLSSGHGEVYM